MGSSTARSPLSVLRMLTLPCTSMFFFTSDVDNRIRAIAAALDMTTIV